MNKNSQKPYTLTILIAVSAALFTALGIYAGIRHYDGKDTFSLENMPIAVAMQGFHDRLYIGDLDFSEKYCAANLIIPDLSISKCSDIIQAALTQPEVAAKLKVTLRSSDSAMAALSSVRLSAADVVANRTYDFTAADDDYFNDACFIGDSRTVGIRDYAGIEGAVFLCKSSLTIYDYDKPKISYEGKTVSVKEVLGERKFGKIYIMVGINECGTGTPESFGENYKKVIEDIQLLQPDALIFIQGNLFVTEKKSNMGGSFTNENIADRNNAIAALADRKNIFYIDVNESGLCEDNALVPEYTWDQVHIKAQYYEIWKDFLLQHAIIK